MLDFRHVRGLSRLPVVRARGRGGWDGSSAVGELATHASAAGSGMHAMDCRGDIRAACEVGLASSCSALVHRLRSCSQCSDSSHWLRRTRAACVGNIFSTPRWRWRGSGAVGAWMRLADAAAAAEFQAGAFRLAARQQASAEIPLLLSPCSYLLEDAASVGRVACACSAGVAMGWRWIGRSPRLGGAAADPLHTWSEP